MAKSIKIPLAAVLKEAADCYAQAKSIGISVPTFINPEFKGLLYSVYRDPLTDAQIDLDSIGALLGNKERWNADLCKLFTLRFIRFFMLRTPVSGFDPNDLLVPFLAESKTSCIIPLRAYDGVKLSPNYMPYGPNIFLCEPRTLSIKAKSRFPNVEKARVSRNRHEYMYKWINLRYKKSSDGRVTLQPFPNFEARRLPDGRYSTKGLISDLEGDPLKYSICQLANSLKIFVRACLEFSVSTVPNTIALSSANALLDIVNIIERKNYNFELEKDVGSDLPLFQLASIENVRINGDSPLDNVYFIPSYSPRFKDLFDDSPNLSAFRASQFSLIDTNICSLLEDFNAANNNVYIHVFETRDQPTQLSTKGVVIWEDTPFIEECETLLDDEFIALLS